jgi:hypothetical protein
MILSGAMYLPEALQAQGLVEEVAEPGLGRAAVEKFIRSTQRQLRGYQGFLEARRRTPLWPTHGELVQVVEHWVECVKQISERDLRLMDRLISAQNRLHPADDGANPGLADRRPPSPEVIRISAPDTPVAAPVVFHVDGRFPGDFLAVQAGHEMERRVNPRRNARRGQNLPVVQKSPVVMHRGRRSQLAQQLELQIVGGGLQTVEQPGLGEEKRAGADGQRVLCGA